MAGEKSLGKPTTRRYSDQEKAQAVRLVRQLRKELGTDHGTVYRVARQLGYGIESVRAWVRQADIDDGVSAGTTTTEAERIKALEQEVRELRRANDPQARVGFLCGGARPPTEVIVEFIDGNRDEFGVEPICAVLQVAPSTYYAVKSRPVSARAIRDAVMIPALVAIWAANYRVYGAHKLWKAARRAGPDIGRDQVARLMRQAGIEGVCRRKRLRTTRSDPTAPRPADLVKRDFTATAPNQLWVTDLTYVPTWAGVAYVCFIVDAFSRMIFGWRVAGHMRTGMVLDALEMARWSRGTQLEGLRCHSDAGSQSIYILGVHPTRHRLRSGSVDGIDRRLLRQCRHRVVLEQDASRAPRPATMAHPGRVGERDLRIPGDLPQPPAAALVARNAYTNRIRNASITNNRSMRIQRTRSTKLRAPHSLHETRGGSLHSAWWVLRTAAAALSGSPRSGAL